MNKLIHKFRGKTISAQQGRVIRYLNGKIGKQAGAKELRSLVDTPAVLDIMVRRGLLKIKAASCYYIPQESEQ